jgi:hypothetical protein
MRILTAWKPSSRSRNTDDARSSGGSSIPQEA